MRQWVWGGGYENIPKKLCRRFKRMLLFPGNLAAKLNSPW